jgi:YD repeat-containing protein
LIDTIWWKIAGIILVGFVCGCGKLDSPGEKKLSRPEDEAHALKLKSQTVWKFEYAGRLPKAQGIKVSSREYDERGNTVLEIEYAPNGQPNLYRSFAFDKQGRKSEESWSNARKEVISRFVFQYAENGLLNKEEEFGASNNLVFESICLYTGDGKLVQKIVYTKDQKLVSKLEIKYDEKGHKTESSWRSEDGKLKSVNTFQNYDEHGNPAREFEYDYVNSVFAQFAYTYDKSGNLAEKSIFDEEVNLKLRNTYQYDASNLLVGESAFNAAEALQAKHTYRYDKNGLLLEKTDLNSLEEKTLLTKYEYEYYN